MNDFFPHQPVSDWPFSFSNGTSYEHSVCLLEGAHGGKQTDTHTHLNAPKYVVIYKPHLRSYAMIKHVASTENKPWHAMGERSCYTLQSLLLHVFAPSIPLSVFFFYSQRNSYAARRESGQTLLAGQLATEFFLT